MQIIRTIKELENLVSSTSAKIGFVPTMGALHNGHVSLIKKCVNENEISIVSTFVNPTQFLPGEDLDKYPRNEQNDIKICEQNGVSAIFIPDEPLIVAPKKFSAILEGKTRPGHFDGVLRVLNKLFRLTRANSVYMGKKDTQQLIIVQNMIKTFFLNTNLVACDIVREPDGLALSSRNVYICDEDKCNALRLSRSLNKAQNLIQNGEEDASEIKTKMLEVLEPLKVDYVAITDRNLNEISKIEKNNTIILVAAYVGKTRLIDNIWI